MRALLSRLGVAAMLVVATVACDGDGGGPAGPSPVITGRWSGSAKAGLVDFEARFTQERGDSVGGTGRFSSPLGGDDFVVTGIVRGADVSLVLTSDELGATAFDGRFTGADRIEGTLVLPGRDDLELTIDRER